MIKSVVSRVHRKNEIQTLYTQTLKTIKECVEIKYKLIDGKMVRVSDFESERTFVDKKVSYVWTVPEVKPKVLPIPDHPTLFNGRKGFYARSLLLALAPIVGAPH